MGALLRPLRPFTDICMTPRRRTISVNFALETFLVALRSSNILPCTIRTRPAPLLRAIVSLRVRVHYLGTFLTRLDIQNAEPAAWDFVL